MPCLFYCTRAVFEAIFQSWIVFPEWRFFGANLWRNFDGGSDWIGMARRGDGMSGANNLPLGPRPPGGGAPRPTFGRGKISKAFSNLCQKITLAGKVTKLPCKNRYGFSGLRYFKPAKNSKYSLPKFHLILVKRRLVVTLKTFGFKISPEMAIMG